MVGAVVSAGAVAMIVIITLVTLLLVSVKVPDTVSDPPARVWPSSVARML
ncbi:MAG: hypothetical protein UX96_C0037G0007 [Candidatus Wolfebacteria bacterium GW2011_GWB1_47_243]|nr:MAG: hypothetical protein UX96_C0037G0007 [Candidatus Wolfebacteria bacterium GW2011_GWB1_47_243]